MKRHGKDGLPRMKGIGGALGLTNLQWGATFKGVMVMPPTMQS